MLRNTAWYFLILQHEESGGGGRGRGGGFDGFEGFSGFDNFQVDTQLLTHQYTAPVIFPSPTPTYCTALHCTALRGLQTITSTCSPTWAGEKVSCMAKMLL